MNSIKLYLQKNSYKKIIYIIGDENKINDFDDLINSIDIDTFFLYLECNIENIDTFKLNKNIKLIDYNNLSKFIDNNSKTLIILDNVEKSYFDIINQNSNLLINNDSKLSNFKNWEIYRNKASTFVSFNNILGKIEVLESNKYNEIELSIIIPFYNVEKYIDTCIKSLLKWDASYIEFIFVDDGSKDDSINIVNKYMKFDKRIKLLTKKNGGCASARKAGLNIAKGRYIGFVDPDDFIDESMFKKLFSRAMNGGYDICYCGYNEFYETTHTYKKIDDLTSYPYLLGTSNKSEIVHLIAFLRIGIWRAIYSRGMLNKYDINFYTNLRYFDDLPFKIQTLMCSKSVVSINEHLYYYRLQRPGQDISKKNEDMFIHFDIFKKLDKFIFDLNKDSETITHYQIAKINTYFWALSKIDNENLKKKFILNLVEDIDIKLIKKLNKIFLLKKNKTIKLIQKYVK